MTTTYRIKKDKTNQTGPSRQDQANRTEQTGPSRQDQADRTKQTGPGRTNQTGWFGLGSRALVYGWW